MLSANVKNQMRKAIYRRDGYMCVVCGDPRHLQIHHLIPRSHGGITDPQNMVTICPHCHNVVHQIEKPETGYLDAMETQQAIIAYLADYYAPNWYPWKKEPR